MKNTSPNLAQSNSSVDSLALEYQKKNDVIEEEIKQLRSEIINERQLDEKMKSLILSFEEKARSSQDFMQQEIRNFYKDISIRKEKDVDEIKSEVSKTEEQLDSIKKEVDALQIEIMQPKTWYRDAPTIISLLAVVFSLSTALASYWQVENQNRLSARSELRGLIQRLTSMPKEQAELYKAYSTDAATLGNLTSNWNTEYVLLASQAKELADRIPNDISAPEYYAIVQALINNQQGGSDAIPILVDAGLKVSRDINTELALTRSKANYKFMVGDIEAGRETYQRAIDLVDKYDTSSDLARSHHAHTRMVWANSEYMSGNCDRAKKISDEAINEISDIPSNPFIDSLKGQINSAKAHREKNTQRCQS